MEKDERIDLGRWSLSELDRLIYQASRIGDPGERIELLSRRFLGIPYRGSTLIGNEQRPEIFVVNLSAVDCFTFIDYIEAMRISDCFDGFISNLRMVRYRGGAVSFETRNHFFTDWREHNSAFVGDLTEEIGEGVSKKVSKILNEKADVTRLLPGIPSTKREITYIPSSALDRPVIENLKTGDYAGIYSEMKGLDVSHVGIVVKAGGVILRHASEKHMKVIDEDFKVYISDKPGIVILRPKLLLV
jgi:hypothetical protein